MDKQETVITRAKVRAFTRDACLKNSLPDHFFDDFWNRLSEHDDIYKEYVYYLVTQDFLNEVSVEGYHVIDILVWQMDHFKVQLDRDTYEKTHNETVMILNAFDIFLKMAEDPKTYKNRLLTDTGTDYPDKY